MPSGTAATLRSAPPVLDRSGSRILITAESYSLEVPDAAIALLRAPIARLRDASGRKWSDLSLLSSAHTHAASDETVRIESIDTRTEGNAVELRVVASSSVWNRRDLVVRCTAQSIEVHVEVQGAGALTDVTVFGGRGAMPNAASGEFRSDIRFGGVLVPAATEPVQLVRPSETPAALSVVGDADAGRLNAVFSPPPLALGLSRKRPRTPTGLPGGDWMGLWLRSPVDLLTMTAMRYLPLDGGFLIQLDYEGHTHVDGAWSSPVVVLRPADEGWQVLEDYRDDLVTHGMAPERPRTPEADWWREPIFCGWGAQCARAVHALHEQHDRGDEVATVRSAPSFAREDVYDELLDRLSSHDLTPGTIVIDDRWQSSYGTGEVDREHWPDLRGWIDARHAEGRRVLLWWKAWDAEGIPADECVRNAAGDAVSVDAGNAAYRTRLAATIHRLLSTEGLDADGLKIDFTQRGPSGESLTGTPGVWGIAALHLLLSTIADAAHAAKPDALLIAHAVHPSFADVCDMVRLNDVSKRDTRRRRVPVIDQLAMRHGIASRVLPHHPIDTDQWPMPNRSQWLSYVEAQGDYGVPALYYVETIDRSGERIRPRDLDRVAESWRLYRERTA
ncbi:MAG TPA: hypothetical protein VGO65_13015 [Pseudolysinimonas sp.]|nr:hypothetical protein [Pseudolysinimonas sp.]